MNDLKFGKTKAHRDRTFLDWLRDQPCAVTQREATYEQPNEPAHTFKSTGGGGASQKSGDKYAVALTHEEHAKQGRMSELTYWRVVIANDDVLLKQMVQAYAEKFYYNRYLLEQQGKKTP